MEPCQAEDGYEEERDDDHDDDGDDCGDGLQLLRLLVVEDEDQAEDEDADHVKREGDQKHEEVAIIPPTWNISHLTTVDISFWTLAYAIVDPGTVVVKYKYTYKNTQIQIH